MFAQLFLRIYGQNCPFSSQFLPLALIPRGYIKDLGKYTSPLYNKTSLTGQRKFNSEDVKLVKEIKEKVKNLPELSLPLDSDYLVIECDGCELGWGAILKKKKNKYANTAEEEVCTRVLVSEWIIYKVLPFRRVEMNLQGFECPESSQDCDFHRQQGFTN